VPEKAGQGSTGTARGNDLLLHLANARAIPHTPPQRCAPGGLIGVHRQRGVIGDADEFELETFKQLLDSWA